MSRSFMVMAVAVVATAALAVTEVSAQGIGAKATASTADPTAEIKKLRAQLEVLDRRVQELEQDAIEDLKEQGAQTAASDASEARIEQRLAALEKNRPAEKSSAADRNSGDDDDKPLTVTAPFVVRDREGKVIMAVQERGADGGQGSRGLYIYGSGVGSALAHVGELDDGNGRVYVSHVGANRPDIVLAGYPDGPVLQLNNPGKGVVAKLSKSGFTQYNVDGQPIAEIGMKDGRGLLFLNNASGAHMVEAGSLVSNKGYVLAQPYTTSVDPHGDPSVLKGGGKP